MKEEPSSDHSEDAERHAPRPGSLVVFQIIAMQQATLAVLFDVIFFNFVSMRLSQHSLPIVVER